MANLVVSSSNFYGGTATDEKLGIPHSHAYSRAMDFRKKPSQMSVLPATRRIGAGVVSDLIQNIVQVQDGARYALGDAGFFYKIDTSNVVSVLGNTGSGAFGMLYRKDVEDLYLAGVRTVSRYAKIGSSPALQPDKYKQSRSTDAKAYRSGGGKTSTLPSSIDETKRTEFQPDIEPCYSVKVQVIAKGTGDWTATIHDDANNTLGTSTVATANVTSSAELEFVFSTPLRMLVKPNARTYHIHITTSDASGTMASAKENDHTTADFQIWADRLVQPQNGMHPMTQFLQYTVIGNERYLSVHEPLQDDPSNAEWERHKLVFPPGYEVCGLTTTDEFLVIACEKRSSSGGRKFQDGKLFMWDGVSTTYNFFIDVPEGSPQGIFTYGNIVYFISGGALYAWPGGRSIIKVRTLPDTDSEYSDASDTTEVYPHMMTMRRGILLMGYPSSTTSQSIKHGVYSWGAIDKNFPMSFGYSYVISSGTVNYDGSNALRIGCVRSFGDEMYVSYRDDSLSLQKYRLDIVDNSSDPAGTASWESRIFDAGVVYKQKLACKLVITTKDLPSSVSLTLKYKLDRASSWTSGEASTTGTRHELSISNGRFYEIQYGFDITTTGSSPVEITGVSLEFSALSGEKSL